MNGVNLELAHLADSTEHIAFACFMVWFMMQTLSR
jgi:hypothetical protein